MPEEATNELTPRSDRHAEPPRGPWAVASVVEGLKIGDIIPISDTSVWVSLEGAMLVRMNVGPTAGAVVYCRRVGQSESSDQFVTVTRRTSCARDKATGTGRNMS